MEEYCACGLGGNDNGDAHQISREGRPGHDTDGRDHPPQIRFNGQLLFCGYKNIIARFSQ